MEHLYRLTKKKVFRFIIAGGTGAATQITILYVLTLYFKLWYLFSGLIAFVCSVAVSFILQKLWTFRNFSKEKSARQAILYCITGCTNLVLNLFLLYVFVDFVHINYIVAQIIASILIAFMSFMIYHKIFKQES
jgi:putative flippase GtrA